MSFFLSHCLKLFPQCVRSLDTFTSTRYILTHTRSTSHTLPHCHPGCSIRPAFLGVRYYGAQPHFDDMDADEAELEAERQSSDQHEVNHRITAKRVHLVDGDGKSIGIMDTWKAMQRAEEQRLDLVVMSPGDIPVCKILNYGKYRYNQQVKKKHSTKVQSREKELRFGAKIDEHDVQVKVMRMEKFLLRKIRVKITVTFDNTLPDKQLAEAMIDNIYARVSQIAKKDTTLEIGSKMISCSFSPLAAKIDVLLASGKKKLDDSED
jgi:translation initiation factor IF-3